MKNISLSILVILSLLGTQAIAKNSAPSAAIPSEVSALMLNSKFQNLLNKKNREARNSGRTLHIVSFDVLDLGSAKYASVALATNLSTDIVPELVPAGSIIGSISYGPLGESGFNGIYFKPAEEGPGGASVGNQ